VRRWFASDHLLRERAPLELDWMPRRIPDWFLPLRLLIAVGLLPVVPLDCASPATTPERAASPLLLIASSASIQEIAGPAEVSIGQVLPDAALDGLNGPPRRLREFLGKPLLINVWASWCGPCRAEMASLERLAWRDETRDFAIIGISTDDYPDRARALLRESNATISHFIDRKLQMENMLGASRLPLTVLVDAGGRVIEKIYGSRQWDSAESRQLIAKAFHRH
jgi:thiol-disulfide isomerase/thioredoxin